MEEEDLARIRIRAVRVGRVIAQPTRMYNAIARKRAICAEDRLPQKQKKL